MAGFICEYSWRHRHLQIVREIVNTYREKLSSMDMLHYSLSSYAVYKIVAEDKTSHIHTAITLVEKLFDELGDNQNETLCRTYSKLLCGLKMKLVFDCLERTPRQVVRMLAVHFPRRRSVISCKVIKQWPDVAKEAEDMKRTFRIQILSLASKQLCVRHKEKFNLQTIALLQPALDFFRALEEALPPTYLDKLMQEQDINTQLGSQLLSPNISEEIIKDFVYGKFRLDPADLRALLQILENAETSVKYPSLGCLLNQYSTLEEQHSEENAEVSSTVVRQASEEGSGAKFADTEKVLDTGSLDEDEWESSGTSDKTFLIPDIRKFCKSFNLPVCIVKVFYVKEFTDSDTGLRHKIFR